MCPDQTLGSELNQGGDRLQKGDVFRGGLAALGRYDHGHRWGGRVPALRLHVWLRLGD